MIEGISFVVPDWRVDANEIAEWTGADPGFITDKIGIESRRFLRQDEAPSTLAAKAVDALRQKRNIEADPIEFLIAVTQTPDYRIPHMSAQLQKICGLPENLMAFDLSLGCSGYVYALAVAKGLLNDGMKHGLIVTCDPYSKVMNRSDKATVTVFGDGASCTHVSSTKTGSIGVFDFGTDGGGGCELIVKDGGGAKPLGGVCDKPATEPPGDPTLYMNGRSILNFMLERVPGSVEACLSKNGLTRDDVDLFVFHQASAYLLRLLANRMDLDLAKVPIRIRDTGNTVSSTIPAVLSELLDSGALNGKKVLVSGFGVGLSWGTTVVDFQESDSKP